MIPHAPDAVRMIAQRMLSGVIPDLKSTYTMSDGSMLALLLMGLSGEVADGIARRLADIQELHLILAEAGETDIDPVPASMRLADVNAVHDRLTAKLIALHERIEGDSARDELCLRIWKYLGDHAARHQLHLP